MNMDVYNSLPDDLKAIINDEELIKKLEDANREDGFGLEESSIKWAQDTYGVTVVTLLRRQKLSSWNCLQKLRALWPRNSIHRDCQEHRW